MNVKIGFQICCKINKMKQLLQDQEDDSLSVIGLINNGTISLRWYCHGLPNIRDPFDSQSKTQHDPEWSTNVPIASRVKNFQDCNSFRGVSRHSGTAL